MPEKSTSLSPCGQLVRQHDSDRFLCALFAPVLQRERLFTLLAFNHEIAKIHTTVTEPVIGQMRLQWWHEAIEAMVAGGRIPAHEVAQPLGELLRVEPGLAPHLLALIEAREQDLTFENFTDAEALQAYAAGTSIPLLRALGWDSPDIATAYAMVGLLRAGRCRDPEAVKAIAATARRLLATKAQGQARLWQALARLYLKQLQQAGYDVTAGRFVAPHPRRVFALLWAYLTR